VYGTERPLQNRAAFSLLGFVEAARFLGGQAFDRLQNRITAD
jgi:hypothetical protein